jgi:hypothetical protein
MNPSLVVVLSKVNEFPFKVQSVPEEDLVKVFTANGSDESLNEGMGKIGSASPGAIDDQELLFHEQAVGDDGPRTAGFHELGDCGQ